MRGLNGGAVGGDATAAASNRPRVSTTGSRRTPFAALSHLPRRPAFAAAAAVGRRRIRRASGAVLRSSETRLGGLLGATSDDVRRWAVSAFEHASCDQLEYELLDRLTTERLPRYLDLRGREHLEGALLRERGAILYSGHVRGHYLFFAALGTLGYRPNIVGMPADVDAPVQSRLALERRDRVMRERFGCSFLNMGGEDFAVGARAANALRRNEVVTFEIDHTHSTHNIEAIFLGRPARFPAGPLLIARATGAPLLHFWLHRPPRHTPQMAEIGKPIYVSNDLSASLAALLEPLEANVRRYPASWATWLFPDQRLWIET